MTKIYGYGEDSLTLWLLTQNLGQFLEHKKINDKSRKADCIVFYRPSTGRGKLYGEFDAILGTLSNIYLIESKWISSNRKVEIKNTQIRRHKIFKWYFKKLKEHFKNSEKEEYSDEKWNKFKDTYNEDFKRLFQGRNIPTADKRTKLSRNIWHIISKLENSGKKDVKDILVLFKDKKEFESVQVPNGFTQDKFTQVDIILEDVSDKGWKELA